MKLPDQWLRYLRTMPESGTGYQVVGIELKDGRVFKQAIIDSGCLTRIRGVAAIPFTESDIADVRVTHEKWDWKQDGN